jgi:hypothetical protein
VIHITAQLSKNNLDGKKQKKMKYAGDYLAWVLERASDLRRRQGWEENRASKKRSMERIMEQDTANGVTSLRCHKGP